jgi:hypothetical protein
LLTAYLRWWTSFFLPKVRQRLAVWVWSLRGLKLRCLDDTGGQRKFESVRLQVVVARGALTRQTKRDAAWLALGVEAFVYEGATSTTSLVVHLLGYANGPGFRNQAAAFTSSLVGEFAESPRPTYVNTPYVEVDWELRAGTLVHTCAHAAAKAVLKPSRATRAVAGGVFVTGSLEAGGSVEAPELPLEEPVRGSLVHFVKTHGPCKILAHPATVEELKLLGLYPRCVALEAETFKAGLRKAVGVQLGLASRTQPAPTDPKRVLFVQCDTTGKDLPPELAKLCARGKAFAAKRGRSYEFWDSGTSGQPRLLGG